MNKKKIRDIKKKESGTNKVFVAPEHKKCSIDNLHPNWRNQELADEMKIKEES